MDFLKRKLVEKFLNLNMHDSHNVTYNRHCDSC